MRKLLGLLGIRLLTLDGAEARRCEGAQQVQTDGWRVFVWTVVVTVTIILVTAWLKRRNFYFVQAETQIETVNEINNEVGECETQKSVELIEDVWVSCVATILVDAGDFTSASGRCSLQH